MARRTPPVRHPRRSAASNPLAWVAGLAAVVALAFVGWTLGVKSVQPSAMPLVNGAQLSAQPARPGPAPAAPTPATNPTAKRAAAQAADSLERAGEVPPGTSATGESTSDPPATRQTPPLEAGPLPMPPAPRTVDPGPTLRLAEAAETRGDLNQALLHYRDALRIDPDNVRATRAIARIRAGYLVRRAEGLLEAADYDAARRDAAAALEIDQGNIAATELLKKIEQARSADQRKRPPE